jgi:tetratricopeptide (TPR) repeat protein
VSDFDEYYPAPKADNIGMLSAGERTADLEAEAEGIAQFVQGNLALRNRDFEAAAGCLEQAVRLLPKNFEVPVNLAVALQHLQRTDEAVALLRQLTLSHPELDIAHRLLGFLLGRNGDWEAATATLERGLRFHPEDAKFLLALGEASVGAGDTAKAEVYFARAIESDPGFAPPRFRLAKILFRRGKALFTAGELQEAFSTWTLAHRTSPEIFSVDPEVAAEFRRLRAGYVQAGGVQSALKKYSERFHEDPKDGRPLVELFNEFLFSAGLIPECHETYERLDESESRWRGDLAHFGEHPYAHFRLALLAAERGEFALARDELRWCQDKLTPMKQEMLRLRRLLEFISSVEEARKAVDEKRISGASTGVWQEAGFTDPFQLRAWKETGLEPAAAAEWRKAEFSSKQAAAWSRAKLGPEESAHWLGAGFSEPNEARLWIRGGLTPEEAKEWREQFPRGAEEAVQWRRTGFVSAGQARLWLQVFSFPWAAAQWRDLGFEPFEALSWSEIGFRDPFLAASWKKRGFSPSEALVAFGEGEKAEEAVSKDPPDQEPGEDE